MLYRNWTFLIDRNIMEMFPVVNEIENLDKKLGLLMADLPQFSESLGIMSLIFFYTGIAKGKMLLLRDADFYYN